MKKNHNNGEFLFCLISIFGSVIISDFILRIQNYRSKDKIIVYDSALCGEPDAVYGGAYGCTGNEIGSTCVLTCSGDSRLDGMDRKDGNQHT